MSKTESTIGIIEDRKKRIAKLKIRFLSYNDLSVTLFTKSRNEMEVINKSSEFFDKKDMNFIRAYLIEKLEKQRSDADMEIIRTKNLEQ